MVETPEKSCTILGKGNVGLGRFSVTENGCIIDTGINPKSYVNLGFRSKLKFGAVLRTYGGFIEIGNRVTIGEYSILAGHGGISIGDLSVIGGMAYITAQNHIFESEIPIRFQGERALGIKIGRNVWIGARVTILDGVTIGNNSVIGANSLVTKDVPEKSVAYGAPSKIVRKILKEEPE